MLLTKDNLDSIALTIEKSDLTCWAIIFGSEDSYARTTEYAHLFSKTIRKTFKPYTPDKGYNHEEFITAKQQMEDLLNQKNIKDVCLIFLPKNSTRDKWDEKDPDLLFCKNKCEQFESVYNWEAIEAAEPQRII
jgi:hypothetical protein